MKNLNEMGLIRQGNKWDGPILDQIRSPDTIPSPGRKKTKDSVVEVFGGFDEKAVTAAGKERETGLGNKLLEFVF